MTTKWRIIRLSHPSSCEPNAIARELDGVTDCIVMGPRNASTPGGLQLNYFDGYLNDLATPFRVHSPTVIRFLANWRAKHGTTFSVYTGAFVRDMTTGLLRLATTAEVTRFARDVQSFAERIYFDYTSCTQFDGDDIGRFNQWGTPVVEATRNVNLLEYAREHWKPALHDLGIGIGYEAIPPTPMEPDERAVATGQYKQLVRRVEGQNPKHCAVWVMGQNTIQDIQQWNEMGIGIFASKGDEQKFPALSVNR